MVQVLEGYIFLGNVTELGARLSNAFTSSVSSTVRQVHFTIPFRIYPVSGFRYAINDLRRAGVHDTSKTTLR